MVLFLLIYIFRNEIAEIISFAIFLKFILLMILVASFQTSDGRGWRSEMITEWRQISQPMLLGSVAIGGITQVRFSHNRMGRFWTGHLRPDRPG